MQWKLSVESDRIYLFFELQEISIPLELKIERRPQSPLDTGIYLVQRLLRTKVPLNSRIPET